MTVRVSLAVADDFADDAGINVDTCATRRKGVLYRVLARGGRRDDVVGSTMECKAHGRDGIAGSTTENNTVKGEGVKSVIIKKTRHKEASGDRERVSDVAD